MFKYVFCAALAVLSVASGPAQAEITGTAHDLGGGRCEFCHTPLSPAPAGGPLWNDLTAATTSFSMYTNPTMDIAVEYQPQGISLVCLSCHDGAMSHDAVHQNLSDRNVGGSPFRASRGGLPTDHRISVTYDRSHNAAFKPAKNGKVGILPLYRAPGSRPRIDQVECGSCHNPHDMTYGSFLRMDTANSSLCLTCHIK